MTIYWFWSIFFVHYFFTQPMIKVLPGKSSLDKVIWSHDYHTSQWPAMLLVTYYLSSHLCSCSTRVTTDQWTRLDRGICIHSITWPVVTSWLSEWTHLSRLSPNNSSPSSSSTSWVSPSNSDSSSNGGRSLPGLEVAGSPLPPCLPWREDGLAGLATEKGSEVSS